MDEQVARCVEVADGGRRSGKGIRCSLCGCLSSGPKTSYPERDLSSTWRPLIPIEEHPFRI